MFPSDQGRTGKAGTAHSWNGGEPFTQIAVEFGDLRVSVPGLSRVQLEQQHVFAIKSKLNRPEIRQRAHKEAGRNQYQQ